MFIFVSLIMIQNIVKTSLFDIIKLCLQIASLLESLH